MTRIYFLHIALLLLLILSGCTGFKHITADDPLFAGNVYEVSDKTREVGHLITDVDRSMIPQPNDRLLWMRPSLARYNMLSDSSRKKKFWKKKIEPSVLLRDVNPERTAEAIENRLFHDGYFYNSVELDTSESGKKTRKFIYRVTLNVPYVFGKVEFPEAGDSLSSTIWAMQSNSKIVAGELYTLDVLKEERKRIDQNLKEVGYIHFNPDFISFVADSVTEDHTVNIRLIINQDIRNESRLAYSIGKIYVLDEYDVVNQDHDTLNFDPYFLLTADSTIHFSAIKRGLFIESGALYSHSTRIQTVRYLNNLPIIRSASVSLVPGDGPTELDAIISISKRKQFAYTAEFNTIFRSTNYFGPGVILGYSNRNSWQNAERLKINLTGRFEVQVSEGVVNPAYELGLEANYTIPRFIPSFIGRSGRMHLPTTTLSLGYNLFNRVDLYRLNSVYFEYKYNWRRNEQIKHTFKPLDIIFTQIPESSVSQEFRDYLEDNPGVRRSFDEQFILGFGYEFTFEPRKVRRHDFFLRSGIELAGNFLSATYSLFNAEKDTLGRYHLLGVPFSQYVRFKFDIRYGLDLSERSSLVTRFASGLGIPYGNSSILPYVRQFYVGGTNSLRSFIARSLGPGGEVPPEGFNDITGDLRLEWNLEYRFTIARKLKGALFTDVGNIWLYNDDPARPAGVFRFSTFLDQLAVSAGWGLRWDFDFIVARLDFAYSVRIPYMPEGEKWISKFEFWKPTLNIAIGYPF